MGHLQPTPVDATMIPNAYGTHLYSKAGLLQESRLQANPTIILVVEREM